MYRKVSCIALLTDYGTLDGYAAAMKGVFLSANLKASIVDVTHDIASGNILSASYVLASVFDWFPPGTVFVCVVDPGVGTKRKGLLASLENRFIIAPDNGIISLLHRLKGDFPVHELKTDFLKAEPSATFHGRDVFAPAAVMLARGKIRQISGALLVPVLAPRILSRKTGEATVEGCVIHIDRFGNAVTSIQASEIGEREKADVELVARGRVVREPYRVRLHGIRNTYGDVGVKEPVAYTGSLGFLEIGVRSGSASGKFNLLQGSPVKVSWG
jgi:S-adenosylmethionine hydrolase